MITLLHGDDIEASRNELNTIKGKVQNKEIRIIEGKNVDKAMLIQSLQSSSLFELPLLVIIENLFGKLGRKIKLIQELAQVIAQAPQSTEIIIWESSEVGVTVTKSLGNIQVKLFKTPVVIFQFLDGLKPKAGKQLLQVYYKVHQHQAEELILFMLEKRVQQLIMANDGVAPEGMVSWQMSRLTNQAKLFTITELTSMLKKLVDIEYKLKTGLSPFTLNSSLELFLATT